MTLTFSLATSIIMNRRHHGLGVQLQSNMTHKCTSMYPKAQHVLLNVSRQLDTMH